MRNDTSRLLDMLISSRTALQFIDGMTEEAFRRSKLHQSAVVQQLQIVGEASRAVSIETQLENPKIPWQSIGGMRNRLVHEYFRINTEIVWKTLQEDIPPLIELLEAIVPTDDA